MAEINSSSPSDTPIVSDEFKKAKRPFVVRHLVPVLISTGVASAAFAGLIAKVQVDHPRLQVGYFIDEIPDHTGRCRPYIHSDKKAKGYIPQPPHRSFEATLYADLKWLDMQKYRPATGQEIHDQCHIIKIKPSTPVPLLGQPSDSNPLKAA